jgi:hypothetical protein
VNQRTAGVQARGARRRFSGRNQDALGVRSKFEGSHATTSVLPA